MWKRQRLFHAMDFQSLMYPCFTICRIFGMFPYKINASTFEIIKPHYIVSIMIGCFCCVAMLTYIYNIMIVISIQNFEKIITGISGSTFFMLNWLITIITFVLSGPQMRLLQTISKVSQELSSESYQKLSRLIHAKDIFGIIFLIIQTYSLAYKATHIIQLDYFTIFTGMISLYFFVLTFEIIMIYINCVCVLKACFKSINDNLAHMQRLMVNDIKSCVPGLICQRNQTLLLKLKALKKWHLRISDTVQMLNTIFGLQLLGTIMTSFINITFDIYSSVVHWQDGVFINFDMHFLHIFSSSIVYYVVKITLLVWVCETGKNQAQEISTTVHDLLNNIKDEQIKNEVKMKKGDCFIHILFTFYIDTILLYLLKDNCD